MMQYKINPISSFDNLRDRLLRLFKVPACHLHNREQLAFGLPEFLVNNYDMTVPTQSAINFLDFMSDSLPHGDLYLFGGVLRDLALFGKKGFNSDIDLVVEGSWDNCTSFLEFLGARKNKFGGYRLEIAGWPIDIWNAEETWAIKQGKVAYAGIKSLTETTVLNWDAILMNWRTRNFIYRERYLSELSERMLDVLLEDNPNPLGMAVRVFRHLCSKDARKITVRAAEYLGNCTVKYAFHELKNSEIKSYGNSVIEHAVYLFFRKFHNNGDAKIDARYLKASESLSRGGITLSCRQFELKI